MAPAGCHTHRHASRDSYYKNMISLIYHILLAISHHIAYPAKTSYTSVGVKTGGSWVGGPDLCV